MFTGKRKTHKRGANMNPLDKLSEQWLSSKIIEDEAKTRRIAIEKEIASLIPGKDEGSESALTDKFRVTVERKLNYSFDPVQWELHKETPGLPVRFKKEIDMKAYRAICLSGSNIKSACDAILVVKPSKPTITIKGIDE